MMLKKLDWMDAYTAIVVVLAVTYLLATYLSPTFATAVKPYETVATIVFGALILFFVLKVAYDAKRTRAGKKCTAEHRKLARMDYEWHLKNHDKVGATKQQVKDAGVDKFLRSQCNPDRK